MQMTVIEKCQKLQLINYAFNIEHVRQRNRRCSNFIIDDPTLIAKHDPFVVSANCTVAAEGELFAGQKSLGRKLPRGSEQPREIPRQPRYPLHIKAAIKIVGFGFRTQPPNTADTAKSLVVIEFSQVPRTVIQFQPARSLAKAIRQRPAVGENKLRNIGVRSDQRSAAGKQVVVAALEIKTERHLMQ